MPVVVDFLIPGMWLWKKNILDMITLQPPLPAPDLPTEILLLTLSIAGQIWKRIS